MFNSPLSFAKAEQLVVQLALEPGSRVLDVGCGDGAFLRLVAERYEIEGLGIDLGEGLIAQAQAAGGAGLEFVVGDAGVFSAETPYSLIICIGSEFIFGGYEAALQQLKNWLTPDGMLLMGTIYWKQLPPAEYLALMGGENPHFDHATTVSLAVEQGFLPFYVCRSNDDEWDAFESGYSQQDYRMALASEPDVIAQIERAQQWQAGYLKWGVHTMGFGFYLLRAYELNE